MVSPFHLRFFAFIRVYRSNRMLMRLLLASMSKESIVELKSNIKQLLMTIAAYCLSYFSTSLFTMVNSMPACLNISMVSASA